MKQHCQDHLGNQYNSIRDMCQTYNIRQDTYLLRKKNGWSTEKALLTSAHPTITDHLNNNYTSIAEMCEHYNITPALYHKRIDAGWSTKDALMGKPLQYVTDHLGNKYTSTKAMCQKYNINPTSYRTRLKTGWSIEDALTKPTTKGLNNPSRKNCTDHLGNKYDSQESMCNHYNIPPATFLGRLKRGYSLEEALTAKVWNRKVTDHLGHEYPSNEDMAKHYGLTKSALINRLLAGWTLEDALTTPMLQDKNSHKLLSPKMKKRYKCKDHLGNEYSCKNDMAQYYGFASWDSIRDRLRCGLSLEETLTIPLGKNPSNWIACEDHLGNKYKNIKQMCDAYNITTSMYRNRKNKGWSIEKILTTPKDRKIQPCTDHLGNKYAKLTDMCNHYGIDMGQYYTGIKRGIPLEKILTEKIQKQSTTSLAETYPETAKLWHPTKNGNITPSNIKPKSAKRVWWKCPDCGYEWQTSVHNKVKNMHLCPECAKNDKLKQTNFAIMHPEMTIEWHPTFNGAFTPDICPYSYTTHVWWRCHNNHNFLMTPRTRHRNHTQCPYCTKPKKLYASFKTIKLRETESATYYGATCTICGYQEVLTPDEMLEHQKQFHPNTIDI